MGNNPRPIGEHLSPGLMKVNLGAGRRPLEGFDNTDLHLTPGIDYRVDLHDLPLPWGESTLDMVVAMDVLEHVHHHVPGHEGDFFWHLVNNLLHCLKDGAVLEVHSPHRRSPHALETPDHLRIVSEVTFRPWMQGRYPSTDNRVLRVINGTSLDLVEHKVNRHLQIGPLSDYHLRKYLGVEVGRPWTNIMVFRVRK